MVFMGTAFAMGASGGAQAQGAGNPMQFFIMIGLIIAIFYFLLIRPQQKKQKDHRKMIDSLEKGDEVITAGGIHGTISKVKDDVVFVEVADQLKLRISRGSIAAMKKKAETDDDE